MHRKIFLIIIIIFLLGAASLANATVYSIQLKNGQEINVRKYWDDGRNIRFYQDNGSVAIPKESIKRIIKKEGETKEEIIESPVQVISPETDQRNEPTQKPDTKKNENELAEIRDRIDIIKSNMLTLNERKNFYITQRNAAVAVKQGAEDRLREYQKNTYITSEDLKQNADSEQRKIRDAEEKIRDADSKIMSLDETIENQENMKNELEQRLK